MRVGGLEIDTRARSVRLEGEPVALTQREYALLVHLAADPERVFTKDELLDAVWGHRSFAATRTLDSHACRLREKLARSGDRAWVINVWGVGYALRHSLGEVGVRRTPLRRGPLRPGRGRRARRTPLARGRAVRARARPPSATPSAAGRAWCAAAARRSTPRTSCRAASAAASTRLCVVALCRAHHRAYDRGGLDLVPHLEPRHRAQAAHAVAHLGLVGALRRLSGGR